MLTAESIFWGGDFMSEAITVSEPEVPTFTIGLAMAGAISAGAYTAGVMDTLFLALDAHQRKFEAGEVGYRVVLKVMSGSSAGGICSALGALALAEGVRRIDPAQAPPLPPEGAIPAAQDAAHIGLPLLYELWVKRLNLLSKRSEDESRKDPEIDGLLSLSDLIEKGSNVRSILDSTFIDSQAQALLKDRIKVNGRAPLGYVAADLEIFLTTTNLMGVPYEVKFSGEDSPGHLMASHGAVTHFTMKGIGSAEIGSHWLTQWEDAGNLVSLDTLEGETVDFSGAIKGHEVWKDLLDTAVASGAFPVGLSSRPLVMKAAALHAQAWAIDANPKMRPKVKLTATLSTEDDLPYIAVDGGVANNEPFELARYTLRPSRVEAMAKRAGYLEHSGGSQEQLKEAEVIRARKDDVPGWQLGRNPRGANQADRAVIMIDPFPEGPELRIAASARSNEGRVEAGVVYAARKLLPSLINQARFKPVELMNATDDSIHSRFLISPSLTLVPKPGASTAHSDTRFKLSGSSAIASGFLGGFGGFFSEAFREHDYRLGQKNCRSFLENYFVLGEKNELFKTSAAPKRPALKDGKHSEMVRVLQFDEADLPDVRERFRAHHNLPILTSREIVQAVKRIRRRVERAGLRLVEGSGLKRTSKLLIDQAWNGVGVPFTGIRTSGLRKGVLRSIELALLVDLTARRQSERSMHMTDSQRALYVGLLRHGDKPATLREIAQKSMIIPSLENKMFAGFDSKEIRTGKTYSLSTVAEVKAQIAQNNTQSGWARLNIRKAISFKPGVPVKYVLKE